jgi:hypothetical protein
MLYTFFSSYYRFKFLKNQKSPYFDRKDVIKNEILLKILSTKSILVNKKYFK